ncbi:MULTISPECIES: hypothetical protein [Pseudomonas]|uniref:Uncharacterized protein n=1 Tax=Pseudomonas gingeri TaxID=117681 RepID=A0A7Y8BS55_9PSED|nr:MULTISPECIES: hypothetical protein [Pseudomonas]MBV6751056.1 hypothetical protein [Pseudomonas chlororaphis]NWB85894.1 hypothetical protein [Pseudomonas gingeri]
MSSKGKKVKKAEVGFKGPAKATLAPEVKPGFKGAAEATLKPEVAPKGQAKP